MYINVKAKKGRVAFTAASGGARIPEDRYISVEHTAWIERLLSHHKDIESEPVKAAPVAKPPKGTETAPVA